MPEVPSASPFNHQMGVLRDLLQLVRKRIPKSSRARIFRTKLAATCQPLLGTSVQPVTVETPPIGTRADTWSATSSLAAS